ncbi:hypothetical protein ABHI18_008613 [Aspergillus niger]
MVFPWLMIILGAVFRVAEAASLPIVDLGYELHQASSFSNEHSWYSFGNIRYAAPPLGQLRFQPPVPPMTNRSEIQTGDVGRVCPQADMPQWELAQLIRFLKSLSLFPKSFLLKGNSSSGPFHKCPLILKAGLALLYLIAILPITKNYPRPLIKHKHKAT